MVMRALLVKRFNRFIFWKLSVIIRTRLRYQTRIFTSFLRNCNAQGVDKFNLYSKIILQYHCITMCTMSARWTHNILCVPRHVKNILLLLLSDVYRSENIKVADFAGPFVSVVRQYDDDTRSYPQLSKRQVSRQRGCWRTDRDGDIRAHTSEVGTHNIMNSLGIHNTRPFCNNKICAYRWLSPSS